MGLRPSQPVPRSARGPGRCGGEPATALKREGRRKPAGSASTSGPEHPSCAPLSGCRPSRRGREGSVRRRRVCPQDASDALGARSTPGPPRGARYGHRRGVEGRWTPGPPEEQRGPPPDPAHRRSEAVARRGGPVSRRAHRPDPARPRAAERLMGARAAVPVPVPVVPGPVWAVRAHVVGVSGPPSSCPAARPRGGRRGPPTTSRDLGPRHERGARTSCVDVVPRPARPTPGRDAGSGTPGRTAEETRRGGGRPRPAPGAHRRRRRRRERPSRRGGALSSPWVGVAQTRVGVRRWSPARAARPRGPPAARWPRGRRGGELPRARAA